MGISATRRHRTAAGTVGPSLLKRPGYIAPSIGFQNMEMATTLARCVVLGRRGQDTVLFDYRQA